MTDLVETADGTRIAYDRRGSGPVIILIGGAGQFRAVDPLTRELTDELRRRWFPVRAAAVVTTLGGNAHE
jgi:hypothetical protein